MQALLILRNITSIIGTLCSFNYAHIPSVLPSHAFWNNSPSIDPSDVPFFDTDIEILCRNYVGPWHHKNSYN